MVRVKRLVLDVLKPHAPNGLEFCYGLAAAIQGCRVSCRVLAVDKQTESVEVTLCGEDIPFDAADEAIRRLGGSLHSIDDVECIDEVERPELTNPSGFHATDS